MDGGYRRASAVGVGELVATPYPLRDRYYFDPYTLPDGGDDNALFSLNSAERATSGTVSLAFKTVPDYEMPGDNNADNEYQIRVVNTHNIHLLGGEGSPTGCSGSVLDVTIRVKDVSVPAPPEDIEAEFRETDDTKIDVNWTASTGFSENGSLVEFPSGFEVTDYDYRYRAAGTASWTEVTDTDLTETTVTLEDLTEDAYEIQVRANNSEGSGAWSSTIRAERAITGPAITGLQIISTPESGTTYGRGEIIKIAVVFDMPVEVTGAPFLAFQMDSDPLWEIADYKSGSGTERLVFEYCVARNDRDRDGISVKPNRVFQYKESTITAVSGGADANLDHAGLPADPNHKVNGCLRDE